MKTQTFIENGKKVTRTEKTTLDRHGQKKTEVTEEVVDGNGGRQKQSYLL